jgi:hypothetical protein
MKFSVSHITQTDYLSIVSTPLRIRWTGTVQRDLTGVESRLKRSALINYLVALVNFFNSKEHSCERSKKNSFSVLTTIELNLPVEFTISVNDGLRTFNLKKQ